MDIQHTAKDFDLTDAIRDHAEEKMGKACSQLSGLAGVHMHLTYESVGHGLHGDNRGVQVVLFVPKGEPIKAHETTESLYAALDLAAKDIERQVRRYCDKHGSHRL